MEKYYISPESLYADSYKMAYNILHSDFRPDFIVALWRGGTPIGIIIQEYLAYHGIETDHIPIRTSAYQAIGVLKKSVAIHGTDYLLATVRSHHKLLLIDDVFDSGLTHQAVIKYLKKEAAENCPKEIKIATLYYKPENRKADMEPDYFIHKSDQWLVFPHELTNLTPGEIRENKSPSILPFFKTDNE